MVAMVIVILTPGYKTGMISVQAAINNTPLEYKNANVKKEKQTKHTTVNCSSKPAG